MFRSLQGSAGLHQGHGSSFCDASSSRDPDTLIPRRLASPCVVSDRCSVGEGQSPFSLSRPWDCHQSPQVSPGSDPVCHPSGNVLGVSNFEGFSLSREGSRPSYSDNRISILQAAKRHLLAQCARPVVPLTVSPRWLSPDAVPPARSPLHVGLCQLVSSGGVVSVKPRGPSLVVRHLQPPALCFSSSSGFSLGPIVAADAVI